MLASEAAVDLGSIPFQQPVGNRFLPTVADLFHPAHAPLPHNYQPRLEQIPFAPLVHNRFLPTVADLFRPALLPLNHTNRPVADAFEGYTSSSGSPSVSSSCSG
jgi:hypothetical protein